MKGAKMEITTFNPLIVSNKADELVALFEELGFEKRHAPLMDEIYTVAEQDFRLKDANGFSVDVAQHPGVPQDNVNIRMNVRNFDEAYEILKKHGFKNSRGEEIFTTNHSKAASMVSDSGLSIALVEHLR
jgi:hypothetical protein